MALNETILPEFDQEMAITRKSLKRIPQEKLDWKPHEKSMSLIGLATHMANLLTWTVIAIDQDSFDMSPEGGEPPKLDAHVSVEELLETFDKNVAHARAAIAAASDKNLLDSWSLLSKGEVLFTLPRVAVIRSFVMNHMIHHRAQLGVYLRLSDVAVPSTYGPSADETM